MAPSAACTMGFVAAAAAATTAAAASCSSVTGMVIGLNANFKKISSVPDVATCCSDCQDTPKCLSFTFHTSGTHKGSCWLHTSANGTRLDPSAISGVPRGPMPPLPPPPPPPHSRGGTPSGPDACTPGTSGTKYRFCDPSLSVSARLDDLVPRINLTDIGLQLTARESQPIPELGLPSYYWGTNAIHGLQDVSCLGNGSGPCPTSFPAPCALSATFNMSLVYDMGNVLGRELRAYYNAKVHNSLDTWSPTININRDPRWGRNVESPGEDPLLVGRYGVAYTQGLQQYTGQEDVVQAVVTLKHFLAYSIENYDNTTRKNVDVDVSAYDMANTYMPAWETLVKTGKALGIMCSYNAVNGYPTCGNPHLNATLREDWGFAGYMTSDSDSCQCITKGHTKTTGNAPVLPGTNGTDATRQCLLGGTDIDSGGTYLGSLQQAVLNGEVEIEYARIALRNTYRMRMLMGLFDPIKPNPYKSISTEVVGSSDHQAMSLLSSLKSMVLLKKGPLPFSIGKHTAVIGQSVTNFEDMTGNYDGPLCPKGNPTCFPSIGDAINSSNAGGVTTIVGGSPEKILSDAVTAAKQAQQVVLVVDNKKDGGGEGHDRYTIGLSQDQIDLANAVIAANTNTVLVLVNGGIIAIDDLKQSAPAILEAFMPGVHGGTAIASTIFGANNPGGKMPVTMYDSNYTDAVEFLDMGMQNRSYRYYTGTPLYPFGFGLSYTNFEIKWNQQPPVPYLVSGRDTQSQNYTVTVTNTGPVAGDEVVMAMIVPRQTPTLQESLGGAPIELKRMLDFERVTLAPGASKTLDFSIAPSDLALVDANGDTKLHNSNFEVIFTRGHGSILKASVAVNLGDDSIVVKKLRRWW